MNEFWEDYEEPSEYDRLVYELKESLKSQIKQEVTDKIKRLEKELNELKEFRDNKQKYDNKISELKFELEKSENSIEEKAKKLKLNEFLSMIESPAWCIKGDWEYVNPKCDKCDDNRIIHFFAPSGKEHTESCPHCGERKYKYFPEEAILVYMKERELKRIKEYEMNGVELMYVHKHLFNEYFKTECDYTEIRKCYSGEDISKLSRYTLCNMYYRNIEDCKRACEYLQNSEV